jgi:hypothetical protein
MPRSVAGSLHYTYLSFTQFNNIPSTYSICYPWLFVGEKRKEKKIVISIIKSSNDFKIPGTGSFLGP